MPVTAPTPTARQSPTGTLLREGFKTVITFATNPTISIWESTVKASGYDSGEAIDTTTQHNVEWVTKAPPKLKESTDISGSAGYDPDAKAAIRGQVGKEQIITVQHPDASTDAVYGYLSKVEFPEYKRKEFPMLTYTIVVTNWDPTGKGEAGEVHTNSAGT